MLNQTPSAFRQLIRAVRRRKPADLALALRDLRRRGAGAGGAARPGSPATATGRPRLVNMYGITETTVHVTYRPVARQDATWPAAAA